MPLDNAAKYARRFYSETYAKWYSNQDSSALSDPNWSYYAAAIRALFSHTCRRPSVLDLGCGTGRYFQAVPAHSDLTAIDISENMLKHAEQALVECGRSPAGIQCADFRQVNFPPGTFDLIYSVGVLAEYSPLDSALLNKLYVWLKPRGKLLFTALDAQSRPLSLTKKAASLALPFMPARLRGRLYPSIGVHRFYMSEARLLRLFAGTPFAQKAVSRHASESRSWQGAHFVCIGSKSGE